MHPETIFVIVGCICFGACGIPAALGVWHRRLFDFSDPLAHTAMLVFSGAMCMYLYLLLTYGFNGWLALTYAVEIISWGIVIGCAFKNSSRLSKVEKL